ncbi:MAG: tetratricopeptide repeat protein [Planctomycetales bacterium]|nr:tetratricopeptide repeat protein [Planctomycetales bacterium]
MLLELGLRGVGYEGPVTAELDPFISFSDVRPLFERSGDRMAIPASRQEYFRPDSFPAPKPTAVKRVFCLGGSTVQGRPFAIETAFSTWLQIALERTEPRHSWEVINCGGVSYASYRLRPILEELLAYEPDLIVLYTGQNEFLEERTYAEWRQRPEWARAAARSLESLRIFRLARGLASPPRSDRLPTEVDAMLDYRDGLRKYHRDDNWRRAVADHYELNLRSMIELAHRAGVPLLVCQPVTNLQTPPFKSEPDDLPSGQRQQLKLHLTSATEGSVAARIDHLEQAISLSPRHAAAQFQLAQLHEQLGQLDDAKRHYLAARDEDICPLRMTTPLYAKLRKVMSDHRHRKDLYWVDILERFEAESPGGITGEKWLVDHVHPSIYGHQRIALWICEALAERGVIQRANDHEARCREAFRAHLEQLPSIYFEQAKRRLEGLRRWAQGRALKVRNPGTGPN